MARFEFELDAGQYHMLSNRLPVCGSKIYPVDMLSYPLYSDSIASYGVFYPNAANEIEMSFELASLLSNTTDALFAHKDEKRNFQLATLDTNYGYINKNLARLNHQVPEWLKDEVCHFYCVHRYESFYELLSTLDTQTFEDELLNLHVGTRLDINPKHLEKLCSALTAKGNNNNATMQAFQDFTSHVMERNRFDQDEMRDRISYLIDGDIPLRPDMPQIADNGESVIILIDADGHDRQ